MLHAVRYSLLLQRQPHLTELAASFYPGLTLGCPGQTLGCPGQTLRCPGLTLGCPGQTQGYPGLTLP
eukprot:1834226-Pyramimonas_sp.AAC.1